MQRMEEMLVISQQIDFKACKVSLLNIKIFMLKVLHYFVWKFTGYLWKSFNFSKGRIKIELKTKLN